MTTLMQPPSSASVRDVPFWQDDSFNEIKRISTSTHEQIKPRNECRAAISAGTERLIIGQSTMLREVLRQVAIVAPMDSTILILGETGTGKELIADAVHRQSSRRNKSLVKVNCAAMPAGLLESELFGHERGAFTGAIARKAGRFELAHQGTMFLDEIGDIPLELQPKLLRVLQEQQFERVGSTTTTRVDTRIVAATSRDLSGMVNNREFRSDLFYRLNVFPIRIPALRERLEDIPLLVQHFVTEISRRMQKQIEIIPTEIMKALAAHSWPGNIRELRNFIERSVILTPGNVLTPPLHELSTVCPTAPVTPQRLAIPSHTLKEIEREHILLALHDTDWVVGGPTGAATRLGLKRTTLAAKMQKLGISRPTKRREFVNIDSGQNVKSLNIIKDTVFGRDPENEIETSSITKMDNIAADLP
jgi:formate hydrogenlyase transcriptional activator